MLLAAVFVDVYNKNKAVSPTTGHRDYRQPPERKSMHARIVHDLGMRIVAGEFRPGRPTARRGRLLADYDVSRPVLREATRVLVAKGLVLSSSAPGRSCGRATSGTCSTPTCCTG